MTTELVTGNTTVPEGDAAESNRARRKVYEPEIFDPEQEARLQRILVIARLMDDSITVPGTDYRVGWDAIVGLIPGIGDLLSAAVSSWIIYEAKQLGLPKWKLARMMANVGIDTTLGVIPFVGDAFDATFKANLKNCQIIHKHFGRKEIA